MNYQYRSILSGTQGYRFGLKKNVRDKNVKSTPGDPKRQEERMESQLSNIDTLQEPPVYVDSAQEVQDSVQKVIDTHREEIFGSLANEENKDVNNNEEEKEEHEESKMLGAKKKKEKGKKEENISMRQFWRYRSFYRKELIDRDRDHRFHWLWTMRKLAEFFVITIENRCLFNYLLNLPSKSIFSLRIEQNEMKWVKLNQENLREILAQDLVDALAKGVPENGTLGKIYMSPTSYMGSKKYYQKCYADLMKVVQTHGNPTW